MADIGFMSTYVIGEHGVRTYTVSLYVLPSTYMVQCRRKTVSEAVKYLMDWLAVTLKGDHEFHITDGNGYFQSIGDLSIEDAITNKSIYVGVE